MHNNTRRFMKIWECPKPVIGQLEGWALGGATDMVLCCDQLFMADDAVIGYPPSRIFGTPYSRMWGCHHAGMWVYRLGLAQAKELALTGRALSGVEAAEIGLINAAYPFARLEGEAHALAERLCSIPLSQLTAMKLVVNQAYENMGLRSTQYLGSLLDGMLRNTPEALRFVERAEAEGVSAAVAERDDPFGDYSRGAKPDPANAYPAP
jgi:enoyl-CoA hydratase